ncbi:helix-turn-helix domain-containing protein [Paenibacillus wynnii]|uniref:helix-turn-helix domain-containing protein n=1 Tax=Paenibacillus wynnii TaxID=268407 RepID=UPI0027941DD4|nr:helix-turn-helix domain-containing protein [Paenibacillus wynnii]MDQ0196519.1 YesN/AraC family two-component response regulator [Paenibacillus wynnii]
MLRYKFKYLLKNKQTRLILMLTLGISILITLIGLYSYREYRNALDTELNTPNVELLQINQDVTNRAMRESDNMAVDLSFQPAVIKYIAAETSNNEAAVNEPLSLLKSAATEPDIHSISIIKFKDQSVLSSEFGYKAAWEDAPDFEWSAWIDEIKEKPLLIKRRLYNGDNPKLRGTELVSLARPIVQNGEISGAVMINLDYDWLFSQMYTHLSNYQFVYNLDGELIYPKLNLPFTVAEMNEMLTLIDVSPFAHVSIKGQDYMANQTFSNVTGWRLVSLVPMEQLLKNVKIARNMMLLLSFISICVGCSGIYYYNFAAFRPLKRINKLLSPDQKAGGHGDLHDLEPVIGKLVGDFQSKSLVADWSLPELRSKFVQDLITRSIGTQETHTKWEHYFQGWKEGSFEIIVISIDRHWQWASAYMEEDQMLLKYAMNNVITEYLESSWRTVTASPQKDSVVVLLQSKTLEEEALREDAGKLIEMLQELLKLSVSIGIGSSAPGILNVTRSYTEASLALSYRLYEGYGQVRDYSIMNHIHEENAQAADDSLKTEVLQALKSSDSDTSVQWIRRWAAEIRKKAIQPQKVFRMVDDLLQEILTLAIMGGHALPPELADYTWHQVTTMDLSEIEEMLCHVVTHMSKELGQHRQSKEYQLVQAMIQYMQNNLQLNIGLQEIASHVNMGVSSVSTIFKEETGTTVYDYLTNLRIDKACELLKDSSLKIADIALLVGYQNENSFIRVFRKNKSITPGKFRENSKYSNEYADQPKPRHSGVSEDSE